MVPVVVAPPPVAVTVMVRLTWLPAVFKLAVAKPEVLVVPDAAVTVNTPEVAVNVTGTPDNALLLESCTSALTVTAPAAVPAEASVGELNNSLMVGVVVVVPTTCTVPLTDLPPPVAETLMVRGVTLLPIDNVAVTVPLVPVTIGVEVGVMIPVSLANWMVTFGMTTPPAPSAVTVTVTGVVEVVVS